MIGIGKNQASSFLRSVKKRLKKKGVWYGVISKNLEYGFITTKDEPLFVRERYEKMSLGAVASIVRWEEFQKMQEKLN